MVCDISPTHKILKYAEFQPAFPYNNTSNGVTLVDYHEHSARNNHQIKAGKWNLFRLKKEHAQLKKNGVSQTNREKTTEILPKTWLQTFKQKWNHMPHDQQKTSSADLPILLQGPRRILANYLLLLMFQKSD